MTHLFHRSVHRTIHLIHPTSWIIGAGLSSYIWIIYLHFSEKLNASSELIHLAQLTSLIAFLAGLWVPTYFAKLSDLKPPTWMARFIRLGKKWTARQIDEIDDDQHFALSYLKILASASLTGSAITMLIQNTLLPYWIGFHQSFFHNFHWTPVTLQILDGTFIQAYVLIPVAWLGFAFNCIVRAYWLQHQAYKSLLTFFLLGIITSLWLLPPYPQMPIAQGLPILASFFLITGFTNLIPLKPQPIANQYTPMPEFSNDWRRFLCVLITIATTLSIQYLVFWSRHVPDSTPYITLIHRLICLLFGWIIGNYLYKRWLNSMHDQAVAAMLVAWTITGAIVLHDPQHPLLNTISQGGSLTLIGIVLGCFFSNITHRGLSPPQSLVLALSSVAIGLGIDSIFRILQPLHHQPTFQNLVLIILLWLSVGGLLLLYEPRFQLSDRLPHAAMMVLSLALLTFLLPSQAPLWARTLRQQHETSQISFFTNNLHLHDDDLIRHITDNSSQDHFKTTSMEHLITTLRLSKNRYRNIFFDQQLTTSQQLDSTNWTSLCRLINEHLQPNGLLLTTSSSNGPPPSSPDPWQTHLGTSFVILDTFPSALRLNKHTPPSTWLAYQKKTSPSLSSAQLAP